MVKSSKGQTGGFTQPLLKELVDRQKTDFQNVMSKQIPSVDTNSLPQPDLYQDPGSGFNSNFVFPQD